MVDLIATSEVSVTVSVDAWSGIREVVARARRHSRRSTSTEGNALVAVIGERMQPGERTGGPRLRRRRRGQRARSGRISYGATKTNLQIVVPEDRLEETVRALHAALFPEAGG